MLDAEINVVLIASSIRFNKSILCFLCRNHMSLITRKPVFGVSGKASFKPVSSATETN